MVAEGLGRRPAPKARAEGALENFGLFRPGFHKETEPEPLAQ